jgi:putative FmdB family regulatory protein
MPEYSYSCDSCQHDWSLFCSMSDYKAKRRCPKCKQSKEVHRNFSEDNIYGAYSYSLSEVKTIGHYADKQTQKYGKEKVANMLADQKTKKIEVDKDLPAGMSRMERSEDSVKWTKDEGSKKRRRINKK